jgi:uncharacterized membrane protein YoaK (UPF0700 family)
MSRVRAQAVRAKTGLAVLLTWVGGYVDGFGYLLLFDLFTSHQSGNSVVLGVSAGRQDWAETVRRGFPIPLFLIGLTIGALLHHSLTRRGIRSVLALPLALEAGVLGLFLLSGGLALQAGVLQLDRPDVFYPIAALPALAMGLQNTTLRKVGGLGVRTTFISGILSSLAEAAVAYGLWFHERQHNRGWLRFRILLRLSPRQAHFNHVLVLGGLWLGFAAGAVSGAVAKLHWGIFGLVLPIAAILLVVLCDLLRPLAASPATDATKN